MISAVCMIFLGASPAGAVLYSHWKNLETLGNIFLTSGSNLVKLMLNAGKNFALIIR